MDDQFSTALEKAEQFVYNVTYYQDSDEWVKLGIPRVFTIQSFLIGEDKPFNLSKIYIPRYELNMDNLQAAGRIDASFAFEQFEIIKTEKRLIKPITQKRGDDAGEQVGALTVDENPFTAEIQV